MSLFKRKPKGPQIGDTSGNLTYLGYRGNVTVGCGVCLIQWPCASKHHVPDHHYCGLTLSHDGDHVCSVCDSQNDVSMSLPDVIGWITLVLVGLPLVAMTGHMVLHRSDGPSAALREQIRVLRNEKHALTVVLTEVEGENARLSVMAGRLGIQLQATQDEIVFLRERVAAFDGVAQARANQGQTITHRFHAPEIEPYREGRFIVDPKNPLLDHWEERPL